MIGMSLLGNFIVLSAIGLTSVEADITITGCTEAFIRMTCSSDDQIKVLDMRLTEIQNKTSPCFQHKPESSVNIPHALAHLCEKDFGCEYAEGICEGKSDCAFYVSPHLIAGLEQPMVNSVVIIQYQCNPGTRRKTGVAVVALLATVGGISLLVIGGLLLRRVWEAEAQSFTKFDNNPAVAATGSSDAHVAAAASASAATVANENTLRYRPGVEHVSVALETPGGERVKDDNMNI